MSNFLYKYAGQGNIERIFHSKDIFSFRCSYPKDFNDPYELFLTINFQQSPEVLAFYQDAVGQLPQRPTTCFSKSPAVIPMWAHYASNHEGFVIELNEQKIGAHFPNAGFGNVDYQDEAKKSMQSFLDYAFEIGKPRYMYSLHRAILSAAYYTKSSCWAYEMERRMIIDEGAIRHAGDVMLMDIPTKCINSIVIGARASVETKQKLQNIAKMIGCNIFYVNIGRSSVQPFFKTRTGRTSVFDGVAIERSRAYCSQCGEPVHGKIAMCSWCCINEAHKQQARFRNPYRALAGAGILESYIEGMKRISNGVNSKK